ncbi:MAG: GGDEF domain-containing protein, partial [Agathobacter sp.]
MYKRIGVLICQATGKYQQELLKGINTQAHNLGYDVCVFATFIKQCFYENYEFGQKNIFNLINFDEFDGIIIAGDTLKLRGLKETLFPRLKKECSCPVIFVDCENDLGYDNIVTDDSTGFEALVDHLIDVHNCRKILFYSGPYEVSSSKLRFEGYKRSLQKHNLPLDPDFYSFEGNFWYESGEQIAREIIEGNRPRPDAIAFCGDFMALAAHKTFLEAGWKIPEDILITGFDAETEGLKCNPPLTSYSPDITTTGQNAVLALNAKINHSSSTPSLVHHGSICLGGSCGCPEDYHYTKQIYYHNETSQNYENFLYSNMSEGLTEAKTFEALMEKINFFLYLIPEWYDFHLVLCSNFLEDNTMEDEENLLDTYTDTMIQYMKCTANASRLVEEPFEKRRMLPALYEEHAFPTTYYFLPLHMNRRCFGYTVLTFGNNIKTFDINYHNWTKQVCSALEYFRIRSKVVKLATIDALTGVYTRAGIKLHFDSISSRIAEQKGQLLLLVADLDNLKTLNDTLGHQTGDLAIKEFAKILLSVTGANELCARTGGDE